MGISDPELALVRSHAERAAIGGGSNIYEGSERQEKLLENQLTGQLGELAWHVYWYGRNDGVDLYDSRRKQRNLDRFSGDEGSDSISGSMDVKTSMWRNTSLSVWNHRLPVRPHERHDGSVYVLALHPRSCREVWLLGWAHEWELPADPETTGPFEGAFTFPAASLRALPIRTKKKTPGEPGA